MSVSGCVGDGQFMPDLMSSPPPPKVAKVGMMWDKGIRTGVDPANRGAPMYGVSGHIYLFSEGLKDNLAAEGDVVVEMWGIVPEHAQNGPECLQVWRLKKEDLNGVCHQMTGSFGGPCYAVNLPWPGYRPDITQAQMRLRYEPAKGLPVYEMGMIALANEPPPKAMYTRKTETGSGQPIVNGVVAAANWQPPGMVQPGSSYQQANMTQPPVQQAVYQQQAPMQQFAPQAGTFQQTGTMGPSAPPQMMAPPQTQPWAMPTTAAFQPSAAANGEVPQYPVPPPQVPPIREPMSHMPQYADPPQNAPPTFNGGMQR